MTFAVVVALMAPVPIAWRTPAVVTWIPLEVPVPVTWNGVTALPEAVKRSTKIPVPVLLAPSVILNRFVVLVVVPYVNVVAYAAIERDSPPPLGFVSADYAVAAEPEQEPHAGVPPPAEVRQRVPAPPVAVETRFPPESV